MININTYSIYLGPAYCYIRVGAKLSVNILSTFRNYQKLFCHEGLNAKKKVKSGAIYAPHNNPIAYSREYKSSERVAR
jgi:hypothetical protein